MIYYIVFVCFTWVMFLYHEWYIGNDIRVKELMGSFVISILPIVNLVVYIYNSKSRCNYNIP